MSGVLQLWAIKWKILIVAATNQQMVVLKYSLNFHMARIVQRLIFLETHCQWSEFTGLSIEYLFKVPYPVSHRADTILYVLSMSIHPGLYLIYTNSFCSCDVKIVNGDKSWYSTHYLHAFIKVIIQYESYLVLNIESGAKGKSDIRKGEVGKRCVEAEYSIFLLCTFRNRFGDC